jgi:hypothetical protein
MNEKRFLLLTRGLCIIVVCVALVSKLPLKPQSKQPILPTITATMTAMPPAHRLSPNTTWQSPRNAPIRIYEVQADKSERLIVQAWIRGNKTRVDTKRPTQGQYREKSSRYTNEPMSYVKKEGIIYKYEPNKRIVHIDKNVALVEGSYSGPDFWARVFLCNEEPFDVLSLTERTKYEDVTNITYQGRPAKEIISRISERFTDRRRIEFLNPTPEEKKHFTVWIDHEHTKKTVTRLEINLNSIYSDTIFDTNYPEGTRILEYSEETDRTHAL